MSLKAFVEAVADLPAAAWDWMDIEGLLEDDDSDGGNPPPEASVHDEMMCRWPTRQEARQTLAWPPFFGHRRGKGDLDAE